MLLAEFVREFLADAGRARLRMGVWAAADAGVRS